MLRDFYRILPFLPDFPEKSHEYPIKCQQFHNIAFSEFYTDRSHNMNTVHGFFDYDVPLISQVLWITRHVSVLCGEPIERQIKLSSVIQSNHALSGLKAALGLKDLVQETNVVDNID